ncbi:hypothetical protein CEXT_518951 [Caerostris extrusa]|uniref:Reverse transcriptase RNase H-like domain-containing protein n=1 Tax=Caerostris extrusa TaxID=172846 RepID=A0AAV4R465_CAEEX|nr:hypothetical protein CEXT_518951 [Caerostris extrusa]
MIKNSLTAYSSIQYLFGDCELPLYTDHKSLTLVFHQNMETASSRPGVHRTVYCGYAMNIRKRKPTFHNLCCLPHPDIKCTTKLISYKFKRHLTKKKKTREIEINAVSNAEILRFKKACTADVKNHIGSQRYSEINVEIISPLPSSSSRKVSLLLNCIIDRCSRWPEATPYQTSESKKPLILQSCKNWNSHFGCDNNHN